MNSTNSSTVAYAANSYDYSNWNNQWKNVWVFTATEQNCDGQICPTGTFCMRPAVSMSPMHCVHADFVHNVVGALKLGNKQLMAHHENILTLLIAVALYLIFFVLLAHLFLLAVRLRQLLSPYSAVVNDVPTNVNKLSVDATGSGANVQQCGGGNANGCGTENAYGQTEFNANAKYIAHQHQSGGAGGLGQMLLNQSQEFHHTPFTLQLQNMASFHH